MYRIGIDLGGTNIAAGITDTEGNILYKGSLPTGASRGRDAIIDDIAALCRMLCRDAKISFDEIGRIGIAVPGGVDAAAGEILFTPNIPLSGINICEILSEKLDGKPVHRVQRPRGRARPLCDSEGRRALRLRQTRLL